MPVQILPAQALAQISAIVADLAAAFDTFDPPTQQRLDQLYAALRSALDASRERDQQAQAAARFLADLESLPAVVAAVGARIAATKGEIQSGVSDSAAATICPSCAAAVRSGANFCTSCGFDLRRQVAPPPPARPASAPPQSQPDPAKVGGAIGGWLDKVLDQLARGVLPSKDLSSGTTGSAADTSSSAAEPQLLDQLPPRLGPAPALDPIELPAPEPFAPPTPWPAPDLIELPAPPMPEPFAFPTPAADDSVAYDALPPDESAAAPMPAADELLAADVAIAEAEPQPAPAVDVEPQPAPAPAGALGSVGASAAPLLTRYPEIDYPSQVEIGARTSLSISLLRAPSAPRMMSPLLIADTGVADQLPQIEVVVRARGFDIEQSNTQLLDIARDDDAELRFVLTPRQLGPQTIRIDFYQAGRRIGTLRQETAVVERVAITMHVAAIERGAPEIEPLQLATAEAVAPDLELCVETDPNDPLRLYFSLHSTIESIGYHHAHMGEVRLSGSPLERMQAVYAELSGMAGSPPPTPDETAYQLGRLAHLGNQLWEELFSDELKAAYWQFKDHVTTLLITSDEPWIPWEMIRPFQFDAQSVRADEPFLCERFIVARWLSGAGPAERVPVQRVRPVAPAAVNLESVQNELAYLERIGQLCAGLVAEAPYGERNRVIDLFERGVFNVLHFAAHGSFDAQMPDNSAISLTGGPLRPSDLIARFGGPRARPLIFINACHGARAEFAFTGLGGWADRLVRQSRVGAFVGAAWEVNDRLALLFAETFYTALLRDRKSIGESFRIARQQTRDAEPSNSTWLAYVLYADPSACVVVS